MKLTELRKVIREEVKAAIQEELKDILLEAVRSPKPAISTDSSSTSVVKNTPSNNSLMEQREARQAIMAQMMGGKGDMTLTANDANTFRPQGMVGNGAGEGTSLPEGNVGLDQIMGLMTNK